MYEKTTECKVNLHLQVASHLLLQSTKHPLFFLFFFGFLSGHSSGQVRIL